MSGLLGLPVKKSGWNRVTEVFHGRGMEQHARTLKLGAYVVRGVVDIEQCDHWPRQLEHCLTNIANHHGDRSTTCKGSVLWYRTVQSVSGVCICKYAYEGTARSALMKTERIELLNQVPDRVHTILDVPRQIQFDECASLSTLIGTDGEDTHWTS